MSVCICACRDNKNKNNTEVGGSAYEEKYRLFDMMGREMISIKWRGVWKVMGHLGGGASDEKSIYSPKLSK